MSFGHRHHDILGYTPRLALAYMEAHETHRARDLADLLTVNNHAAQGDRNSLRKLRSDLMK